MQANHRKFIILKHSKKEKASLLYGKAFDLVLKLEI